MVQPVWGCALGPLWGGGLPQGSTSGGWTAGAGRTIS